MNVRLLDRITSRDAVDERAVDPRIAARRDAVRGERRRRIIRWLLVPTVLLGLAAAAWLVAHTPLFDVDHIRVSGTSRLQVEQVVAASGVHRGEPLLDVDTAAAARAVEREPWVKQATVTRNINGVVTIAIVERSPVAVVTAADGATFGVDGSGRVLGPADPADGALPVLESVDAVDPGSEVDADPGALELASLLTPGVRARSTSIRITSDGLLQLQLRPQGVVDFGSSDDLRSKVASLVTVMGQVDQRDLCAIRVINPDTPVVTRTPNCR